MKKLWTDLHSNIHHNQMDELDKWTEHAKEVLDFWPIAYYPFQMIKTEFGAGLEDLCPEEEIKKDWEIVRGKVKEENANGYPMFMGYEWHLHQALQFVPQEEGSLASEDFVYH